MKIIRSFKIRGFILAAAFSAALGFATSASTHVSYLVDLNSKTVTIIGNVLASGINDAGQVTGSSDTAGGTHAFITGPDGMGMRDLESLGGTGVDVSGARHVSGLCPMSGSCVVAQEAGASGLSKTEH